MIATLARFNLSLSPQHDRLPAGGVRFTAVRLFRMNRLLSASPRFKCCLRTICRLRNRGLISGGRIGERDEELGGSRGARARLPAPAPGPRGPVPPGSLSALGVAAVITVAPIRGALGLAETSVCGGAQRLPATHAPPRSATPPAPPLRSTDAASTAGADVGSASSRDAARASCRGAPCRQAARGQCAWHVAVSAAVCNYLICIANCPPRCAEGTMPAARRPGWEPVRADANSPRSARRAPCEPLGARALSRPHRRWPRFILVYQLTDLVNQFKLLCRAVISSESKY